MNIDKPIGQASIRTAESAKKFAGQCKLSELAQTFRELGEEAMQISQALDILEAQGIITSASAEKINESIANFHMELDKEIAKELTESCTCKLR